MYKAIDLHLGNRARDWSSDLRSLYARRRAAGDSAVAAEDAKPIMGTRPTLPLSKYTGAYEKPRLGTLRVTENGAKLRMAIGNAFVGDLEQWQYDTFRAHYDKRWLGTDRLTFTIGDGVPSSLNFAGFTLSRVGGEGGPATH